MPDIKRFSRTAGERDAIEGVLRSDATFREDEVEVALELVDDALETPESDYWLRVAYIEGRVAGYICFGPTPMTASTFDLYWIVCHIYVNLSSNFNTIIKKVPNNIWIFSEVFYAVLGHIVGKIL